MFHNRAIAATLFYGIDLTLDNLDERYATAESRKAGHISMIALAAGSVQPSFGAPPNG